MSMEEVIKIKTEEMVEKYKKECQNKGFEFNESYELLFRSGIAYGITIASMALASAPVDITFLKPETPVREEYDSRNYDKCPKCGGMLFHTKNINPIDNALYPITKCNVCDYQIWGKGINETKIS